MKNPRLLIIAIFSLLAGAAQAGVLELIDSTGDGSGQTLDNPGAIALDGDDNVFVAGRDSLNVFQITRLGSVVTEILDDSHLGAAPTTIATDSSGNVYVSDGDSIFKIDTPGDCSTTGSTACVVTDITVAAGLTDLSDSRQMTVDANGVIFITSFGNSKVFRIDDTTADEILTNTGDGTHSLSGPHGLTLATFFEETSPGVYESIPYLFVTGRSSDNVFSIREPATCTAGSCTIAQALGSTGSQGRHPLHPEREAPLEEPTGIAFNSTLGPLVVGKVSNNLFLLPLSSDPYVLNPSAGFLSSPEFLAAASFRDGGSFGATYLTTFAASDLNGQLFNATAASSTLDGTIDGGGNAIGLSGAGGLAMDPLDNVYVSDAANDRVLKLFSQRSPHIAQADNGDYVKVWEQSASTDTDGLNYSIQAQRFDSNGDPAGEPFQVNTFTTGDQAAPKVGFNQNDDTFRVVWAGPGIRTRTFNSSGVPSGPEEEVTSSGGSDFDFDMRANGDFALTWIHSEDVKAQTFDSNGTAITGELQVNIFDGDYQYRPRIGVAANTGDFVVAWESYYDPDGDYYASHSQRFNSDGTKMGLEMRIQNDSNDDVDDPDLAVTPDGSKFLIVWEGIEGQRYDMASGLKDGSEIDFDLVNNAQNSPTIAVDDSDGSMEVAWISTSTELCGGIYSQRLDSSGAKVGGETGIAARGAGKREGVAISLEDGTQVAAWHGGAGNDAGGRYNDLSGVNLSAPTAGGSASVSGRAWDDADSDGIDNNGESGLSGVTVRLEDAGGCALETTTDGSGDFTFSNLPAGEYLVEFDTPSGRIFSPQNQGSDDTVDSDVATVLGDVRISLADAQNLSNIDAGLRTAGNPELRLLDAFGPDGGQAAVPIFLADDDETVQILGFTIDYDHGCLDFDDTDGDADGVPDALTGLANAVNAEVIFDDTDTNGELEIILSKSSGGLKAGVLGFVVLDLSGTCSMGGNFAVDIRFTPTFIDDLGQDLPGSGVDGSITESTDNGDDGVTAATENGAPNSGDGNGDGILDSEQPEVTSLPNATGSGEYITVASTCPQKSVATSNPLGSPVFLPQGIVGFLLEPCSTSTVTVYFHGLSNADDLTQYWKYDGSDWTELPAVDRKLVIDTKRINGVKVVRATFELVDGQTGDQDGVANNSIDDPGGVAMMEIDPELSIAALTHAVEGETVDVPVSLLLGSDDLGSAAFSIDYDEACLDADADGDGDLDQVQANTDQVPVDFTLFELFDDQDTDGEVDLTIVDLSPPFASIGEGELLSVRYEAICAVSPMNPVDAAVSFSTDPSATFGDLVGQDVSGTQGAAGTVRIWPGPRGDCNSSDSLGAADLIAVALEIFDDDGTTWYDATGSTYAGSPAGCDANGSETIAAGDVSCANRLLFGLDCSGSSDLPSAFSVPELLVEQSLEDGIVWIDIDLETYEHDIASFVLSLDLDPAFFPFAGIDADGDGRPDHLHTPGADIEIVNFDAADTDSELDILIAELQGALSDGPMVSIGVPASSLPPLGSLSISMAPAPSFGSTDGSEVEGHALLVNTIIFRSDFESGDTGDWTFSSP